MKFNNSRSWGIDLRKRQMIALIGLLYQFIQLLPPYRSGLPSFPSDVGAAERAALEASIVPSSTDGLAARWKGCQIEGVPRERSALALTWSTGMKKARPTGSKMLLFRQVHKAYKNRIDHTSQISCNCGFSWMFSFSRRGDCCQSLGLWFRPDSVRKWFWQRQMAENWLFWRFEAKKKGLSIPERVVAQTQQR